MRIVVAPDSFKGTASAADAAEAIADGWLSVRPTDAVVRMPMADGGEGTLDALATALPQAERMPVRVHGPSGGPVDATWLRLPDRGAAVELASTSGFLLEGRRRDGLDADSRGFGEAIAAALDDGATRLVLAIGGSASTDGGTGMLTALGARFSDAEGRPIARGARGLVDLATIDASELRPLPSGGVTVLSDVTDPLRGPHGAARFYGPQKGLSSADVDVAERGLAVLASVVGASAPPLHTVSPESPGAGAAGGVGFALLAWGASLTSGAAEVARVIGLLDALRGADLVITGEGSFDAQSAHGKAGSVVVELARSHDVPVALVTGRIAPDADTAAFAHTVSLTDLAGGAADAQAQVGRWLRAAGAALAAATPG